MLLQAWEDPDSSLRYLPSSESQVFKENSSAFTESIFDFSRTPHDQKLILYWFTF